MATIFTARASRVVELAEADRPAEAALELARFVHPGLDVEAALGRIEAMVSAVEGKTHLALRRVISIAEGFGGNVDDYNNPDNLMLNRVLETRRGVPVTLSVLWIEVGRRVGMEMVGVGLPGHFVVYAQGQMVDPFHYGEAIGFDEAAALVAQAIGGAPRLDRSWLSPVSTPEIMQRILRNLDERYASAGDERNREWVHTSLAAFGVES